MIIRIGTRGSKLALAQAKMVEDVLVNLGQRVELVLIKTLGDRKQGTSFAGVSDKKEWIYDLEVALLHGEIDLAVHSGKDVPVGIEKGTKLSSCLKRATPQDVFIGKINKETGKRLKFSALQDGDIVGTASLRRRAQLLRLKPGLSVREHRGNVPTRIEKLDNDSSLAGIVLAHAGILRLGLETLEVYPFSFDELLPAVCQGTLAAQYREEDTGVEGVVIKTRDSYTERSFQAERNCVAVLEADCDSALSVFAEVLEENTFLRARVLSGDGTECLEEVLIEKRGNEVKQGKLVGETLLGRGARRLLR